MDQQIFVKPGKDILIRDPDTQRHIPPEGGMVPNNRFWRRRIADQDVTQVDPPRQARMIKDKGEDK